MNDKQTKRLANIQQRMACLTNSSEEISCPLLSHTLSHRNTATVMFTSIPPDSNRIQRYLHISCLSHLLQQNKRHYIQDALLNEARLIITRKLSHKESQESKKNPHKSEKQGKEALEDKGQIEKFTRKSSWPSLQALEFISVNTWKSLRPQGASAALKSYTILCSSGVHYNKQSSALNNSIM